MTPRDIVTGLDVAFGVRVGLAPDGQHLKVTGNPVAVACATPRILKDRTAILTHLQTLARRHCAARNLSTTMEMK